MKNEYVLSKSNKGEVVQALISFVELREYIARSHTKAGIVNFPIKMQNGLIEPWPSRFRSNGSEQIDSTFIRFYITFYCYFTFGNQLFKNIERHERYC